MELNHDWLILGTDGSDGNLLAVFHRPRGHILGWVGTDGRARKLTVRHALVVNHDAGIEREEAFGGGEDGIDIDFFDRRILDDEIAEADHEFF